MNVLIIGKFTEGQFGFHISDTLRDMGHNTIEFDPSAKYKYSKTIIGRRAHQIKVLLVNNLINISFYRGLRIKRLKEILEENKIELTISTHDFLYPDEVDLIKEKSKAPIVMWFPDAIGYSSKSLFMISNYDNIFFQDPYIVHILKNQYNKKNIFYLPECCNPKFHKQVVLVSEDYDKYSCDISTYGSPHNYRSFFFNQLSDLDYKIKIWGNQSPIWLKSEKIKLLYKGEYLVNEEKAKAVLLSKINLNTLVPSGIYGLNARTFEIAGIGGFQMIHWRPGLADLFEDGKELVSFNNFDEVVEKINYYLDRPEEREIIAKAGQIRAYKDHTYEIRLRLLIETVFGNANGFKLPSNNLKILN
jgi:spore maturation protein CgeB